MGQINPNIKPKTPVVSGGVVSQNGVNSSTTVLNNGETFTGTGELNDYSDAMIWVATDQSGVLYAEFSQDNTNWDTSLSFNYNPDRINPPHVLTKGFRFFRVRFENNSGSNQTYFRLATYYGDFKKLTTPINAVISEVYDATAVRPTDYHYEVATGKRQGRTTWNKFGYNPDIDTAATEVIASFGGAFTKLSAADTLDFVSTSANDTASSGTGTRSIIIYGVDGDWNQVIEILELDGTTPVTTTNSFLGVNRVSIYLAGSSESNVGDITATDSTTNTVTLAKIPAGEGTTQQAIFYVANNHTALADWLWINVNKLSGGGAPVVTIKGWVYSEVSNAVYEVLRYKIDSNVENTIDLNPSQPFIIGEKSILYFTATTNTNNTVVNVRFSLIESRND